MDFLFYKIRGIRMTTKEQRTYKIHFPSLRRYNLAQKTKSKSAVISLG